MLTLTLTLTLSDSNNFAAPIFWATLFSKTVYSFLIRFDNY